MNIATLYNLFLDSTGVTTDSRNCPEGSIFFALTGDTFNGNTFAAGALEKGCRFAVVDDAAYTVAGDNRYIVVDNALKALQLLANYHRKKLNTPVIGITGTNGKTTTKELISTVLSQKYNVLYTEGNLNNHIGVPLTLLRLTEQHEIAVIEMGASHPGDIKELVDIAEPDYGIVTNVGRAHLEGFGSFENVIRTKGELFGYLREKDNAKVFVNTDDELLVQMSSGMEIIPYGTKQQYINGTILSSSPFLSFQWKKAEDTTPHTIETHLIGSYNFSNALAAVTIGSYFEVEPLVINNAIGNYQPTNSRSQLMKTESNTLIIDAYNANPTSMMASLENFNSMEAANKMVILGDMLELGAESDAEHEKIISFLQQSDIKEVILIGNNFSSLPHPYTAYKTVNEYIEEIKKDKPAGRTILIKGSNSIKLRMLPEYL